MKFTNFGSYVRKVRGFCLSSAVFFSAHPKTAGIVVWVFRSVAPIESVRNDLVVMLFTPERNIGEIYNVSGKVSISVLRCGVLSLYVYHHARLVGIS